ncbi:MAG: FecR family protein [Candidatus Cryptobacteroides sp.]
MDIYLLIRYFACQVSPQEETIVREWLLADTDGSRARLYREAHLMYEGMVLYSGEEKLLHAEAGVPAEVSGGHQSARGGWRRFAVRMLGAAAVAALTVAAAFWGRTSAIDSLSASTKIVRVPAGDRMDMILDDGTHIWLNSGTEIEIPAVFSRRSRNIRVNEGEVLLDVTKDSRRPFTVDTWAGKVTVLGTKFDVAVDESAKEFTTSLLRGSVKVENYADPSDIYILSPNSRVRLCNGALVLEQIRDANSVGCWSQGIIEVSGVPFDELMRRFSRAFDVTIEIEREELPVVTYTRGKIRVSEGLEHALSVLRLASDFDYDIDREAGKVTIR